MTTAKTAPADAPEPASAGLPLLTSAEEILATDDEQTDYVNVPEWGGKVKVRGLMGVERDKYETGFVKFQGNQRIVDLTNARARLVAAAIIDEKGKRVFTDAQVERLGKKSSIALTRVFERVQELSGMNENDIKELVTVLGNAPSGSGGSA